LSGEAAVELSHCACSLHVHHPMSLCGLSDDICSRRQVCKWHRDAHRIQGSLRREVVALQQLKCSSLPQLVDYDESNGVIITSPALRVVTPGTYKHERTCSLGFVLECYEPGCMLALYICTCCTRHNVTLPFCGPASTLMSLAVVSYG
jgi:hypothetical protein